MPGPVDLPEQQCHRRPVWFAVVAPRQQPRALPGEPANRPSPGRIERAAPRGPESRPMAHPRPARKGGHDRGPAREIR